MYKMKKYSTDSVGHGGGEPIKHPGGDIFIKKIIVQVLINIKDICKILIFCFLDLVFLHLSGAFQQTEIWVLLQNYSKVFGEN